MGQDYFFRLLSHQDGEVIGAVRIGEMPFVADDTPYQAVRSPGMEEQLGIMVRFEDVVGPVPKGIKVAFRNKPGIGHINQGFLSVLHQESHRVLGIVA